ncbi:hypothetical protein BTJ68_06476 [Hortaea werneckii EXF-2000]|uniref:Uncharacterized protein n=1 Tax=Hortaea werneckii EXF-2000 TaxID=1157616 RepID=A0A1Z5TC26_HORWE|nr:hypothetical protein BTJ68_06476 [Hortaea werneckii EXF-2000]
MEESFAFICASCKTGSRSKLGLLGTVLGERFTVWCALAPVFFNLKFSVMKNVLLDIIIGKVSSSLRASSS